MEASFVLVVLYTQIAAFRPGFDGPFPLWTDDHVRQGFAWRPGSAAFGVPDRDEARHAVRVALRPDRPSVAPDAVIAVEVPFEAGAGGVEVASPVSPDGEHVLALPPGRYGLVFQTGEARPGTDLPWASLTFFPAEAPRFAILRANEAMDADAPIRTTAEPAR